MKALLFSLLIVIGLDEAFDQGAGVRACWHTIVGLVHGTSQNVGESIYRQ